ncbi:hypothetical protein NP590_16875 [Methylomonas sp. SURF-2]|uniref:Uncharacterized protein n=1 Tax=Methylomonas subterranea TaxID=2952225 RepID=A0ABT1TJZ1_9GAMM|nr:hypothetical protein [Methylomonas sp. SURF-2]MCQ8105785.1 hypothetical protein [Methylomonas sp. SURF-2]
MNKPQRFCIGLLACLLGACSAPEYFRRNISETPCQAHLQQSCRDANLVSGDGLGYTLGFVELDDQGRFYDRGQADALLHLLKRQRQPVYVTVYVHGWNHNADEDDLNVSRFKQSLTDAKQRNPDMNVVGIYVGWRGKTIDLPYLKLLTFWDRQRVSQVVGGQPLLDFLLQVEALVKTPAQPRNTLLTIGHSLGASVVFNALNPLLRDRLAQADSRGLPPQGFGDLVVLVNPAMEARRFVNLREAGQAYRRRHAGAGPQPPLLLIATSEADKLTKDSFSRVRRISALFADYASDQPVGEAPIGQSEWELDTTAVGHYPHFVTHRLEAGGSAYAEDRCVFAAGRRQTSALQGLLRMSMHAADDPYWVVRINRDMLPNHGFLNRKGFLCFIDAALHGVADTRLVAR